MSEAVTKGGAVAGGEEVVTVAETAGEEVEAMPEIELSSDEESRADLELLIKGCEISSKILGAS